MSTQQEIGKLARSIYERTGGRVGMTTYSPGDGIKRYRLGIAGKLDDGLHDYYGDRALVTANGASAAYVMLRAFSEAMDYCEREQPGIVSDCEPIGITAREWETWRDRGAAVEIAGVRYLVSGSELLPARVVSNS